MTYKKVDVDRFDKTVLQVITPGEEKTIYERHNKQVYRIRGPAVPKDKWIQVNTIFSRDENIVRPKPDLSQEKKERLRVINTRFLTKAEKERLAILAKNGIKYLAQGWLKIRSWEKEGDQYIRAPKRVKDIKAAIRMQDHILKKYKLDAPRQKGEFSEIMNMEHMIKGINYLLVNWRQSGKRNKELIQAEIVRIIFQLGDCRNPSKVAAQDRLVDISSLEDQRGQVNPPAKAASMLAFHRFLAKRLNELNAIIPIVALRQEQLKLEISYLEAGNNAALNKVKNLLNRPDSKLLARQGDVETFINQINYILSRFWPSPYYEAGKTCITLLNSVKRFIRARDLPQAKRHLRAARHVLSNEI